MDVCLLVLLTTGARCDQTWHKVSGTNRCESRIITHLMTLRMRGGTLASFFLEHSLLVFKTELEVVHTSIVRAPCDVYLVICSGDEPFVLVLS